MKKFCITYFLAITVVAIFFVQVESTQAVLPPNLVFDISAQVWQFFSIVFIFLSSLFGGFVLFLKNQSKNLRKTDRAKLAYVLLAIFVVLFLSFSATFFYHEYKQNQEIKKWLQNEKWFADQESKEDIWLDQKVNLIYGDANRHFLYPLDYFLSDVDYKKGDDVLGFIYNYYINLSRGNYQFCYHKSEKDLSFPEFEEYYSKYSKIELNNIKRIDKTKSSFELLFYQEDEFEKYEVLMTVELSDEGEAERIIDKKITLIEKGSLVKNDFFEENYTDQLSISKNELLAKVKNQKDYLVVDVREEFEREINEGKNNLNEFDNVLRIRMADLLMGRWLELPRDKPVYIFCQDGTNRSVKATEFLRQKNILAFYIDDGLKKVIDIEAEEYFANKKDSETLKMKVLAAQEVIRKARQEDVVIVSSASETKGYDYYLSYKMTSQEIEKTISSIPEKSRIIILCNSGQLCYLEQQVWHDLEERGHEVIGIHQPACDWGENFN